MKKYFGLNRNVFFTGVTSFLTDTSTKMVYSVMPLFLLSIGASKTTISLIEGMAESTASILKAVSGVWSDRIEKNKPFMIVGYAVTAIVTPVYFFVLTPFHVLVLRFLERLGKGLRAAPRDSLISASVEKNDAGKNFGFHKAMDNSGAILGPLLAFIFMSFLGMGYRNIFLLASIPAFFGVLSIILYVKERHRSEFEKNSGISFRRLPERFYLFIFIIFVFTLGNSTDALLIVKTSETGIDKRYVPFIYMFYNTVSVLLSVPAGKLSDKTGREKLIIAGFFIYSTVYFCFGFFSNIYALFSLFILYGAYSALTDTCQKAFVSDIVGRDLKGTAFGLYHAVLGVTLLPASLIAGVLYDRYGSSSPFYFGSAMAFIAAVLMLIFTIFGKSSE